MNIKIKHQNARNHCVIALNFLNNPCRTTSYVDMYLICVWLDKWQKITQKDHLVFKGKAEYRWKRLMNYFIKRVFTLLSLSLTSRRRISVLWEIKKCTTFKQTILDLFLSVMVNHSFCQISIQAMYLWILSFQHKFLVFADPAYFVGHNVSLQD